MAREQSLRLSDTIVPQKNRYYLRVSRRWRMVGWLFAVALGMFLVVTLSVYGKYITYDNLTYLARDFDLSVRTTDDVHTTVTYPRQEKLAFAPFKSGMAVLRAASPSWRTSSATPPRRSARPRNTSCAMTSARSSIPSTTP